MTILFYIWLAICIVGAIVALIGWLFLKSTDEANRE